MYIEMGHGPDKTLVIWVGVLWLFLMMVPRCLPVQIIMEVLLLKDIYLNTVLEAGPGFIQLRLVQIRTGQK